MGIIRGKITNIMHGNYNRKNSKKYAYALQLYLMELNYLLSTIESLF